MAKAQNDKENPYFHDIDSRGACVQPNVCIRTHLRAQLQNSAVPCSAVPLKMCFNGRFLQEGNSSFAGTRMGKKKPPPWTESGYIKN